MPSEAAAQAPPPAGHPELWTLVHTPEVRAWLGTLSERDFTRIDASIRLLAQEGPALGGGRVKLIQTSRHRNMKELRSVGGHIRILFAFDPRQRAVLLVGGDKTGDWNRWYERNVPVGDRRYDNHLASIGKERTWARGHRIGRRPPDAGR